MASRKNKSDSVAFLADLERRPFKFKKSKNLEPMGLVIGRGDNQLEIAIARAVEQPAWWEACDAWEDRSNERNIPVVLVILHGGRTMICGPAETLGPFRGIPVFWNRSLRQTERVCRAALNMPDNNAAIVFLRNALPEIQVKRNKPPERKNRHEP